MNKTIGVAAAFVFLWGCAAPVTEERATEAPGVGSIVRLDAAFDALVPAGAKFEKLADGFTFTEGPLWRPEGAVWFSDVVGNVVLQWNAADGKVSDVLRPGGYDGNSLPAGGFVGPNGMVADRDGAVLIAQHGNRRIARLNRDKTVTTVVDRFEGKRLSSPNDLAFHSDGSLYFTDPPYGLPMQDEDPSKEIAFNGVYRWANGKLTAVVRDLTRPNGLAFSPDFKTLYVANSDDKRKVWMRYDVAADGSLSNGRVFADVTAETEAGAPDGMKVDERGNVWATGPGGVWVFSPEGKHLGTIKPPETAANVAWGDDGKSLYMTAVTGLYRVKLAVAGAPAVNAQAARGIQIHLDMSIPAEKEKEMLDYFEKEFRPAAAQFDGYIDVKIVKLRTAVMGKAPAGINYRFVLQYRNEELRQKWIASDVHQKVWSHIEAMMSNKSNYDVFLFDE